MEDTAKVPMDGKLPAPEIYATDVLKRAQPRLPRLLPRSLVSVAIFGASCTLACTSGSPSRVAWRTCARRSRTW